MQNFCKTLQNGNKIMQNGQSAKSLLYRFAKICYRFVCLFWVSRFRCLRACSFCKFLLGCPWSRCGCCVRSFILWFLSLQRRFLSFQRLFVSFQRRFLSCQHGFLSFQRVFVSFPRGVVSFRRGDGAPFLRTLKRSPHMIENRSFCDTSGHGLQCNSVQLIVRL